MKSERPVQTRKIPYVPAEVQLGALFDGKLLHRIMIQKIKSTLTLEDGTAIYGIPIPFENNEGFIQDKEGLYSLYKTNIAKGAYGQVGIMQNQDTGEWIAVKIQSEKTAIDHVEYPDLVEKEINALKKMDLFKFNYSDVEYDPNGYDRYRSDYTGMKFIPGVNFKNICSASFHQHYPSVRWIDMAISMIESLEELHLANILHGDIKPDNMIYDSSSHTVRLVDLGSALTLSEGNQEVKVESTVGHKSYLAPELNGKKPPLIYNEKTEIYALGKSLQELFGIGTPQEKIRITDPTLRVAINSYLKMMLNTDPLKRPTVEQVKLFYKKIRKDLLNTPALLNRVMVLDLTQYREATPAQQLTLIASLKQAHEVWLVDPVADAKNDNEDINRDVLLLRKLEDEGIIVNRDIILKPPEKTLPQIVQEYAIEREKKDKNIYICGNVDKEGNASCFASRRHLKKIIRSLNKDLERLKAKYPDSHAYRQQEIDGTISNLKTHLQDINTKPVSYDTIEEILTGLQSRLLYKVSSAQDVIDHGKKRISTLFTSNVSRSNLQSLIDEVKDVKKFRR